jgi:ribosomal protein L44E
VSEAEKAQRARKAMRADERAKNWRHNRWNVREPRRYTCSECGYAVDVVVADAHHLGLRCVGCGKELDREGAKSETEGPQEDTDSIE